jgi:RNA polymerase sigma factor (sigma-70 family)
MDAHWAELQNDFALYRQGDVHATRRLFKGIEPLIRAYFRARTRKTPDSEDLTQATLLKIHLHQDRFDPQRALKTWVFTIASRTLIDHWRGNQDDVDSIEEGDSDSGALQIPSPELDPAVRTQLRNDLNRALETLKPNDRAIVYLSVIEGFSMAEIAEVLRLSESAVKVRAHRSYIKMRELLGIFALLAWGMLKGWTLK